MPFRFLTALVALCLLAVACTSDGDDAADADAESTGTPQIIEADETDDSSEDPAAEPTPTPVPEGVVVSPYELVTGDCFNDYVVIDANEVRQNVTTALDCNRPHDGEVYFHLFYTGDASVPFPGESTLDEWAQDQCFAQFEVFVRQPYELSELDIGMIVPTLETWNGAGLHRQVTCYVKAWRGGQLQGSMRETGY